MLQQFFAVYQGCSSNRVEIGLNRSKDEALVNIRNISTKKSTPTIYLS